MTTPRYLLAKYMPDLMRGEPRNIGVVLWTPETVTARFVAEKPDNRGDIDGRRIPDFVTSQNAYKQWIQYWFSQLEKAEIEPLTGGLPIPRTSPEYLDVLKSTSNGNFVLVDGGYLLDDIATDQLTEVIQYLFSTLVHTAPVVERVLTDAEQPFLQEKCITLLKKSGLYTSSRLFRPRKISCPTVGSGRPEKYSFSYAIDEGNRHNYHLYHRVALPGTPGELQKSVYSANWMFQSVIRYDITSRAKSGVILYADDEQKADSDIADALASLNSVTRVFNLYNEETALLHEWAELA